MINRRIKMRGTISVGDTLQGSTHVDSRAWSTNPLGFALPSGGLYHIVARVTFDPGAADIYQGKTATFKLSFQVSQ